MLTSGCIGQMEMGGNTDDQDILSALGHAHPFIASAIPLVAKVRQCLWLDVALWLCAGG